MVLIGVDVESARFLEFNKPQPVVLFELIKGIITGKPAEMGKMQRVTKAEAAGRASQRKPAAHK